MKETAAKAYDPIAAMSAVLENLHHHVKPEHPNYVICMPPPNLTGCLHMGHAFQLSLMDALVRYARQQHQKAWLQPGTDHAGISARFVLARYLADCNLPLADWQQHIHAWQHDKQQAIMQQMQHMAIGTDWQHARFTRDPLYQKAVETAFIQLFNDGLITRRQRLVNWDPVLNTTLSDLEVLHEERPGELYWITYVVQHTTVVVATTRPETLFGDVALAVSPQDVRYQAFIGHMAYVPLVNRAIPIIADAAIDPLFGSGCVKVTPAHDFRDAAFATRHGLQPIDLFEAHHSVLNEKTLFCKGKTFEQARPLVVAALRECGALSSVTPHTLSVPIGEKSGAIIEPKLTLQWFLLTKTLGKKAQDMVHQGRVRFYPESWAHHFHDWMNRLDDWCISRQIGFGHVIPAFYQNDRMVVQAQAPDASWTPETDVLDTWFSAALWPLVTMGWPAPLTHYPTDVLVTGFDILFFWVARMIMVCTHLAGDVPFKQVWITGIIRDHTGQKMSKTRGNVIDPLDVIYGIQHQALLEKRLLDVHDVARQKMITEDTHQTFPQGIRAFGIDALRYVFFSISHTRDVCFDWQRLESARLFCNKLWQVGQLVHQRLQKTPVPCLDPAWHEAMHLWSCAWYATQQQRHTTMKEHVANFRLDLCIQDVHDYIWHDVCAWYIEIFKTIVRLSGTQAKPWCQWLSYHFCAMLKTVSPWLPVIVATLQHQLNGMAVEAYDIHPIHHHALEQLAAIRTLVQHLRALRASHPAQSMVTIWHDQPIALSPTWLAIVADKVRCQFVLTATPSGMMCHGVRYQMADMMNTTVRLRLEKDITVLKKRLDNPDFLAHAPSDIIRQTQEQYDACLQKLRL
jgi:valyl-tRNA synthetase